MNVCFCIFKQKLAHSFQPFLLLYLPFSEMRPSDTHRLPTKILYDTSILERIIHMNISDY